MVIPEDLKLSVISSVEENARFLSDEELQAVMKDAPPDVSQEGLKDQRNRPHSGIKVPYEGW